MALLLTAGLGYALWQNSGAPSLIARQDFPSKPAVSAPTSSIRDKHRDPSRFGIGAMTRNNKAVVPKMNVKGLVTMNSAWPLNNEAYNLAYSAKAYSIYVGSQGSMNSLMRLKSPLFNGNDRRFNPAQILRAPVKAPIWKKPPPPPEPKRTTTTTEPQSDYPLEDQPI
jgi:hypothetical protein